MAVGVVLERSPIGLTPGYLLRAAEQRSFGRRFGYRDVLPLFLDCMSLKNEGGPQPRPSVRGYAGDSLSCSRRAYAE